MDKQTTLHLMCGKMASGKSTLAASLADKNNAILIIEDEWLSKLYPDEIRTINDYIKYSSRLQNIIRSHVISLLKHGTSVVLDFPANTIKQRNTLRSIFESADVTHTLHYVEASNEKCKEQLKKRNENNPEQTAFTSEAEFDFINQYFQPPSDTEHFNIIRY
ncbi:MAG: ATP-binding protein [Gammaproteobacteria bacterium]|nr:ATP-binding protein [Gammaproteobacteria bacterium]